MEIIHIIYIPTQGEQTTLKDCSLMNSLHILLEMEYMVPLLPNPKAYCSFYHLQTDLQITIAPPMLKARILK
jgi:hypothetical protein